MSVRDLRNVCWSPVIADSAVRTLAEYARKGAPGSVLASQNAVRRFFEFITPHSPTDEISLALVLSYRDSCRQSDGNDYKISCYVRPFLYAWHLLGYPGVSKALIETMATWSLKNPEKGVAVNRLDANAGPLMPDEHISLAARWLTAFELGLMPLVDYVLARLCSVTGRRSSQIMQLKLKDLDDTRFEDPELGHSPRRKLLLHIPRIKARGGTWRARFRAVPLSTDLWNLLIMQRDAVHKRLDDFAGRL